MLGSGVTSLPYHHPLMVAQRFVQLDHMTRGRAMLGVGPGALVSDAYMMGIDAEDQRRPMDESLGAITRLLACEEPVTMKTDWFELNQARLHLAPYTYPHFPIAVASATTPVRRADGGQIRRRACCRSAPGCRAERQAGRILAPGEAEAEKHGKISTGTAGGWSSTCIAPRRMTRFRDVARANGSRRSPTSAKPWAARRCAAKTRWATG